MDVSKGSKTDLNGSRFVVGIGTAPASAGLVDIAAVLLGADGRVRSYDDLVFFNNPRQPGVALTADGSVEIDLAAVPADVEHVLVTGSTEAQAAKFGDVHDVLVGVRSPEQEITFTPGGLTSETVLQMVALYRRGSGWRLDAIGQGSAGLAAFATEHGIDVGEPEPGPAVAAAPAAPPQPVSFKKVSISLTKDSPTRTASPTVQEPRRARLGAHRRPRVGRPRRRLRPEREGHEVRPGRAGRLHLLPQRSSTSTRASTTAAARSTPSAAPASSSATAAPAPTASRDPTPTRSRCTSATARTRSGPRSRTSTSRTVC